MFTSCLLVSDLHKNIYNYEYTTDIKVGDSYFTDLTFACSVMETLMIKINSNELQHDKTNKMTCALSEI